MKEGMVDVVFMKKDSIDMRIGFLFIGIITALALCSFFYTPYNIDAMDTVNRLKAPCLTYFFGTDSMGRDIFSRTMVGARFTLLVAVSTVFSSAVTGTVLGMISGYAGGICDEIIMRLIDAVTSFPGILIALIIVTVTDHGKFTIIPALCIMFLPSFTRIVRGGTLQYKESEFVKNIKVFGGSDVRILFVHIFPNIFPTLLSSIVIGLSNAILAESSMSYLGLGIQPPTPSWGRMLSEAQATIIYAPWTALAPGFMIMVTVIGFHCLGEGIRKKCG
jgi:peptide/nickel transport system permease protein